MKRPPSYIFLEKTFEVIFKAKQFTLLLEEKQIQFLEWNLEDFNFNYSTLRNGIQLMSGYLSRMTIVDVNGKMLLRFNLSSARFCSFHRFIPQEWLSVNPFIPLLALSALPFLPPRIDFLQLFLPSFLSIFVLSRLIFKGGIWSKMLSIKKGTKAFVFDYNTYPRYWKSRSRKKPKK